MGDLQGATASWPCLIRRQITSERISTISTGRAHATSQLHSNGALATGKKARQRGDHGATAHPQDHGRRHRDGRLRHRLFEPQLSVAVPVRQDQDRRQLHASFDGAGREAETVVKTIIALGRELHMRVTVEGVETAEQAAFLEGADGDQAQGFYFGQPVPASEIAAGILADFQQTNVPETLPPRSDDKGLSGKFNRAAGP